MKFNRALLSCRTSQLGPALADVLYFSYPGSPIGCLGGGNDDYNEDWAPVAIMSLPNWQNSLAYFATDPGNDPSSNWTLNSIDLVDPTQAVVLITPDTAGGQLWILFMAPAAVGLCVPVMALLSYNCPNVGPVIPADFATGQGVQYIAVMSDMSKVPCFRSCCIQPSDQRPANLTRL